MKKTTIILLCILFFNSCRYFRGDNCNNTTTILGTYENVNEKGAKTLLLIKEDGSFEQIYTKGDNIKKNTGNWKFIQKSCKVRFENLKLLHYVSPTHKQFFIDNGVYRINIIRFNEDLRKQFDYFPVDE